MNICSLVPVSILIVGTFWLIELFLEEIQMDINHLNELSEDATKNLVEMKSLFNKIIQNSTDVKQLSGNFWIHIDKAMENSTHFSFNFRVVRAFNGIFQYDISNLFMWSLITNATLMLSFLLELVKFIKILFLSN